jgi:hypothetical protein
VKVAGLGVLTWIPAGPTSVPARAALVTKMVRTTTVVAATTALPFNRPDLLRPRQLTTRETSV